MARPVSRSVSSGFITSCGSGSSKRGSKRKGWGGGKVKRRLQITNENVWVCGCVW